MARRPRGGTRAQRSGVTQRRKAGLLVNLDIQGVKEINKRLNRLKLRLAREVVNRALAQGAKRVMQPAINAGIATVTPGLFGTGLLKDRGTDVVKTSKKKAHMGFQVKTPSRTDLNIQGNQAYYPAILEVGGKTTGFRGPVNIEGRHFMRNARDQKANRLKKFLRRTILKFIDEEVLFQSKKDTVRAAKGKKPLGAFRSARQLASFKKRGLI